MYLSNALLAASPSSPPSVALLTQAFASAPLLRPLSRLQLCSLALSVKMCALPAPTTTVSVAGSVSAPGGFAASPAAFQVDARAFQFDGVTSKAAGPLLPPAYAVPGRTPRTPGFGVSPLSPSFARPAAGLDASGSPLRGVGDAMAADALHGGPSAGDTSEHARRFSAMDLNGAPGAVDGTAGRARRTERGRERRRDSAREANRERSPIRRRRGNDPRLEASPPDFPVGPQSSMYAPPPTPASPDAPGPAVAPVAAAAPVLQLPIGAQTSVPGQAEYASAWMAAPDDSSSLKPVYFLLAVHRHLAADVPQAEVFPALHRMSAAGILHFPVLNRLMETTLQEKWERSPIYPELREAQCRVLVGRLQGLARSLNHAHGAVAVASHPVPADGLPSSMAGQVAASIAAALHPEPVPDGCVRDPTTGRAVPKTQMPVFPIRSWLRGHSDPSGAYEDMDPGHFLQGPDLLASHRAAVRFTTPGSVWLPAGSLLGCHPDWSYDDLSPEAALAAHKKDADLRPGLARLQASVFAYYSQVVTLDLPDEHPGSLCMADLFAHVLMLNRMACQRGTGAALWYSLALHSHLQRETAKPREDGRAGAFILRDWLSQPRSEILDKLKSLRDEGRLESLATWKVAQSSDEPAPIVRDFEAPPPASGRPKPSSSRPSAAQPAKGGRGKGRSRAASRGKGGQPASKRQRTDGPPSHPTASEDTRVRAAEIAPGSVCLFHHPAHDPPLSCPDAGCKFQHVDTRDPNFMALYSRAWGIQKKKRPHGVVAPPPPPQDSSAVR